MSSNYNKDSIVVLDDIQHIIKRKGMYIGDADDPHQLISEIIDNAIDEVQGGFSSHFTVEINTKANQYTVRDYGRGIPHGTKVVDGEEKEILEVLCTKSNSGGKFDNSSYKFSSGLHGLGLTITNALSDLLTITSYRDGKYVTITTSNGEVKQLNRGSTDSSNGTKVSFIPNKDNFSSGVIPIEFIKNKCKIASAFGFKSSIYVDGVEIENNYSIFDLLPDEVEDGISTYYDIQLSDSVSSSEEILRCALRYTSATNDKYFGYTNLIYNSMGGTHISEISKAIVSVWKKYVELNKIKTEVQLKPSDYLVGLRAICSVFISNPSFTSQTKERLKIDKGYLTELISIFCDNMYAYLCDNKSISLSLIKRFEEYRISQNKLLARKEISSLIKISNDSPDNIRRRSVVPKLVECTSKKRENTELFITEGDSAAGPASRIRNKELQAVLPLRGKILNVTNRNPKDAVKSQEVCNIVNAIGCGIASQCDSSKSRYDRIIISADADPDGANIVCLVLSVFVNMLPDIVKSGRLYVSVPPLYGWRDKSGHRYTNNKEDIPKGVQFTRYKGLGEMDDEEFGYCCMNPDTRQIFRVDYPSDIDKFNYILGTSVGKASLLKDLGIVRDLR